MLRARFFAGYVALALLAACGGDAGRAMGLGAQAQQELDAGQVSQARQTVTAAIKERDDIADLQLLRGRIELAGNRFGPAFDAFAAALSLDARNLEALQGVAQLGLRTGHIADSEDAADRILVLQPDQPDALLVKGLLALVRSRPEETIKLAERILTISPGNEGGAILKARALYMQGDLSGARAFIERLKTANPNAEGLARTRLELSREAGDAPGMLAEFAVLRRLRSKDLDLRLDEANLRYKFSDAPGARRLLRSSLFTLKPDASQTAQIAALWQEYDHDALDEGDLRTLADSANEEVRTEVARFYLETGRAGVARDILIGARSLEARSLGARALIAAGQADVGGATAESILAQDKTQCDALLARAAIVSQSRRWSDAVVAAQTAAAECPHNVGAPLALARAYEGSRDTAGVRRAYTEGIARNPQDQRLSVAFASWLEAIGERRQALAEARRLTRRAPALVSGWLAYRSACERQDDARCSGEANQGLERARARFGIDLPSGTLPPRGLFGRLSR